MPYCTQADIEAVWNPAAVLASVDDDSSGDLNATELAHLARAIDRASNEIDAWLARRYSPAALAGNAWCRDAAAVIAAYFLAIRTTDPAPTTLREQYLSRLSDLQEIAADRRDLPNLPRGAGELPALSNFRIA